MKLNTLDKATKIYKAIKELDEEILAIEKRANELASGNFEVTAKFSFKNLDPSTEKVKFDEDGSIVKSSESSGGFTFSFRIFGEPVVTPSESEKETFKVKINEREALYMIGALLSIKNEHRKAMVDSLKELGYK